MLYCVGSLVYGPGLSAAGAILSRHGDLSWLPGVLLVHLTGEGIDMNRCLSGLLGFVTVLEGDGEVLYYPPARKKRQCGKEYAP